MWTRSILIPTLIFDRSTRYHSVPVERVLSEMHEQVAYIELKVNGATSLISGGALEVRIIKKVWGLLDPLCQLRVKVNQIHATIL